MDTEKKTFSCVLCGSKLDSKEALQEHFRKHANKEIDAKGNPSKVFNLDKILNKKINNPKTEIIPSNLITCDLCPMAFENVTQAIQHKFRKHPENSAKHFCPFCGMQFPLKFTRDNHVKTHKNMQTSGSFPCEECGEKFYNNQAQNYHFKSTHKRIMSIFKPVPTPPPSKKIKINNANEAQSVYYCYLCGMEYIIKFNLQKHLERSHVEAERNTVPGDFIKCTTCDALFYNKKAYDNHNMYHKPDDLYVTSEEQRLQTVTRVDQDFDIRRVQLVTDKFIPVDKPKRLTSKKHVSLRKPKASKSSDDELSPTSSIESSDSETESLKNKDKKNSNKNIKPNKKCLQSENVIKSSKPTKNNSKKIMSKNKLVIKTTNEINTSAEKDMTKTMDCSDVQFEEKQTIETTPIKNDSAQTKRQITINEDAKKLEQVQIENSGNNDDAIIECNSTDIYEINNKSPTNIAMVELNNTNVVKINHSDNNYVKVESKNEVNTIKNIAKSKYTAKIVDINKSSKSESINVGAAKYSKTIKTKGTKRPSSPDITAKRMCSSVADCLKL